MSKIEFPGTAPGYRANGIRIQCEACVDGMAASYGITAEALEDHFGARSCCPEELFSAYERHREAIESMARELFEITGARCIALHSGHFRFGV